MAQTWTHALYLLKEIFVTESCLNNFSQIIPSLGFSTLPPNRTLIVPLNQPPPLSKRISTEHLPFEAPGKLTEDSPLQPSSPYSASKASADLLCLAHFETFGTDIIITRSSNNYGPRQHHEKLIPQIIGKALLDHPLPLYGDGMNIRDWIHVDDHCNALITAFLLSKPGRVYNFGGHCERTNIGMVRSILKILGKPESLITKVSDRLGHHRRYAIDTSRAQAYFGWEPTKSFSREFPNIVRAYAADFS